MSALFSYSIAVSLVVLLLFPVLHQLVNRSTYFKFNRIAVIGAMLLALLLPCLLKSDIIPFSTEQEIIIQGNKSVEVGDINAVSIVSKSDSSTGSQFPWIAIAVAIYTAGLFVMLCREILSFIRLLQIISNCEKREYGEHTICLMSDSGTASFSWGKYIFLQKADFDDNCAGILLHEEAHTDKRHWIDVLFADLFCIFLWYNPFAWMIKQLLKLNHEFEADEAVIGAGVDTYSYQRMLVTKAIGKRAGTMTNSFATSKSDFHKRVMIMSKNRASKKTKWIALGSVPALLIAWLIISSPISAGVLSSISEFKFRTNADEDKALIDSGSEVIDIEQTTETVFPEEEPDTLIILPSPLNDQKELYDIIRLSLSTIEPDKDTKINIGIVVDEEGRVKEVVTDNADNPLVNLIIDQTMNGIRFEQITQDGQLIQTRFNIPVVIKKK